MKATVISVDIAKTVFQVCALNSTGQILMNERVQRSELLNQIRQFEPTVVALEACSSAHAWGRAIEELGHDVRLIPPAKVKPFVQGNKTDANDALAIAEASQRPGMHAVPIKPLPYQQLQSLYRVRERRIKSRTALINQIRALLAEHGIVRPKGRRELTMALPGIVADDDGVLGPAGVMFAGLADELRAADQAVDEATRQLEDYSRTMESVERAQSVPGVGPIVAAVAVGAFGDARRFDNGRQFAACIGLTPRQHSSGERQHIGSITRRGNRTLRTMLIHGARAVIRYCANKTDPLNQWVQRLLTKKPKAIVIVALANKLARILWAVLAKGEAYQPARLTMA